jgi:hypothetical protein
MAGRTVRIQARARPVSVVGTILMSLMSFQSARSHVSGAGTSRSGTGGATSTSGSSRWNEAERLKMAPDA